MFRAFRRQIAGQTNPDLVRAVQLLADGQPAQAAGIFARLAQQMEASNHPRRAANLHAQAAHAYADDRDVSALLAHSRQALNLFLQYNMLQRAPQFYTNITHKLRDKGMSSLADVLEKEYGARIQPLPSTQPAAPAQKTGRLPLTCPQCGGPVHSQDIEWVDDRTAECAYCGALMAAS